MVTQNQTENIKENTLTYNYEDYLYFLIEQRLGGEIPLKLCEKIFETRLSTLPDKQVAVVKCLFGLGPQINISDIFYSLLSNNERCGLKLLNGPVVICEGCCFGDFNEFDDHIEDPTKIQPLE